MCHHLKIPPKYCRVPSDCLNNDQGDQHTETKANELRSTIGQDHITVARAHLRTTQEGRT